MQLPDFPREFSGESRRRVINAEIMASRAMRDVIRSRPWMTTLSPGSRPSGNKQVIEVYVLPVFLAFAKDVCALGHAAQPWFSDRIDNAVREFLRKLIIGAAYEFNGPDYEVHSMSRDMGYLEKAAVEFIEQSPQWKEYEDLLLKLDQPSTPVESEAPIANPDVIDTLRRSKIAIEDPPSFPKRAAWLKERLRERSWNRNTPRKYGGPDAKTIDKILAGYGVSEGVLERLADSLSKKRQNVDVTSIPDD